MESNVFLARFSGWNENGLEILQMTRRKTLINAWF